MQVSHFAGFSTANNQTFTLSAAGAITGITTGGTAQNRTINSENQITAIGSSSISYDSNGNVTTADQGSTLLFDAWNRLVGVNNSSGQLIATYTYDGLGNIASESSIDPSMLTSATTDLYYAGGQEVEERTGVTDSLGDNLSSNGTVTLNNVFSPNGRNILLRDSGGTRLYFTQDVTGDVTAVLNTSGSVLQRQSYAAYGDVTFLTANFSSMSDNYNLVYLWQNGRRDTITEMYKFGYRWYTPSLQWLSFDPSGYPDGPNGYIDRADNPINYDDWSGGQKAGPGAGTPRPSKMPTASYELINFGREDDWHSNFQVSLVLGDDVLNDTGIDEIEFQQYVTTLSEKSWGPPHVEPWALDKTGPDGYYIFQVPWIRSRTSNVADMHDLPGQNRDLIGWHSECYEHQTFETDIVVTKGAKKGEILDRIFWEHSFWWASKPYEVARVLGNLPTKVGWVSDTDVSFSVNWTLGSAQKRW